MKHNKLNSPPSSRRRSRMVYLPAAVTIKGVPCYVYSDGRAYRYSGTKSGGQEYFMQTPLKPSRSST